MYAAPSGLFYIGPSGGRSLTNDYMDDRDWQALNPETMHSIYRDGEYYGFHEGDSESGCWIFDSRESNALIRRLSQYANAAYVLQGTDELYLADGKIFEKFQGGANRLTYIWRSKEFGPGNPVAMTSARTLSHEFLDELRIEAVLQSIAAFEQAQIDNAANIAARRNLNRANGIGGAINQDCLGGAGYWNVPGIVDVTRQSQPRGVAIGNGSDVQPPAALQELSLLLRVYADNVLIDEQLVSDEEPIRLAYADRSRRWSYELIGEIDVLQQDLAGSVSEMHDGS